MTPARHFVFCAGDGIRASIGTAIGPTKNDAERDFLSRSGEINQKNITFCLSVELTPEFLAYAISSTRAFLVDGLDALDGAIESITEEKK